MKSKILHSEIYILIEEFHKYKPCALFCAASISILSTLSVSNSSQAQTRSPQQQANKASQSLDLLQVPQSAIPSGRTKLKLETVPPPPNVGSNIRATLPSQKVEQYLPLENIKQLENSFIQEQITGKTKRPIEQSIAVERDAKSIGGPQTGIYEARQLSAQAVPLPAPPGSSLEFTSPDFNSSATVAPLPPLPGTTPQQQSNTGNVPTFNQLLNSRTSNVSQYPVNASASNAPTFEQMLDAYRREQPSVSVTSTPTFNTLLNSQGGMRPSAPLNRAPMRSPIKSSQAPLVPQNNELNPLRSSAALRESSLRVEGVFVTQGDNTSARARLSGTYPLTPQVLFGATLDLTSEDSSFDDSRREGLNINELYLATSLTGLPNLRFAVGQLDLTSYFDRNSFAKDGASQFFNPVFQTNPALASTGISSKPGLLVNWSVTDNIDAKAAVFSSSDALSNFSLDGFAGEVGVRYGNAIIRGTYSTARDGGNRDSFPQSFQIDRGNGEFGVLEDDREEAYGLNAEVFIPKMKLGLFGRYGRYENRDLGEGADTYVFGASFLDLFTPDDRLGLAYGRALSNEDEREGKQLDVLELYYDFQFLDNLRLGFSVQGRDDFNETVLGVRIKSEFDVTPRGRMTR
ncbi:carbohydrate porin [Calothrix sp. CCY 0018]|uniref:carbohydrate porin n=1 Tax=Calothrix sp. CCY 0018 TaxID=3103864 RepID=UPI0039C6C699